MSKFYPQYGRNKEGLQKFIRAFSFPGGFPSHVRPPISPDFFRSLTPVVDLPPSSLYIGQRRDSRSDPRGW